MATKLYPPNIEGTLPAFTGDKLLIPFSMNRTVSNSSVNGISVRLKTVQNNIQLINTITDLYTLDNSACSATVELSQDQIELLNIGQFYKVQIAYWNKDSGVGYYSTIGVIKYTAKPNIYIDGLETGNVNNNHSYHYLGVYNQEDDTSEKVYSYNFTLYDEKNKVIKFSGELVHNSYNDTELYTSYDEFEIPEELADNKKYYLQYAVTTINGLEAVSSKYRIVQAKAVEPQAQLEIKPKLNFENGYIEICLMGKIKDNIETSCTGSFKLVRTSSENGFSVWDEILNFALYSQKPSTWSWKDFTVKQGVIYKYAIQQYNDKLVSSRIESKKILADFEHAYLFDGARQLKIKFNPKVASFKNTVLEQKIDTIGGQFPYIFRNGNVKYKEFSISGLVSIWSDEEQLFTSLEPLLDTNLTGENITTERNFKLEVLEWLNNGLPKLFRSPVEGNYIVRLMNVSLAPNDTLGRMLHTFTATAYEIAEFSWNNLKNYDFIYTSSPVTRQIRWETKQIADFDANENMIDYEAVAIKFEGMVPGDELLITSKENNVPEQIIIGITGYYEININANITITSVRIKSANPQGQLTYAYYSSSLSSFSLIEEAKYYDVPTRQFIGEHDILSELTNVKEEVQKVYQLRARLRDIADEIIYYNSEDKAFYMDEEFTELFSDRHTFEADKLYRFYSTENDQNTLYYYDPFLDAYYTDERREVPVYNNSSRSELKTSFILNGAEIELAETYDYTIRNLTDLTELKSFNGVVIELTYKYQVLTYTVENDMTLEIIPISKSLGIAEQISNFVQIQNAYKLYYNEVKEKLKREEEKQGNEV